MYDANTDTIAGMQPPFNISIYPGTGTADGVKGDHILLAPAYNITSEEVHLIVEITAAVIEEFFRGLFAVMGN
jgi:hypothetical protein